MSLIAKMSTHMFCTVYTFGAIFIYIITFCHFVQPMTSYYTPGRVFDLVCHRCNAEFISQLIMNTDCALSPSDVCNLASDRLLVASLVKRSHDDVMFLFRS